MHRDPPIASVARMRREPPAWTREYKLSEFGPGPWVDEPDSPSWDGGDGLGRLIRRTEMGSLCGYVVLPPLHLWSGRHYDDIEVSTHGGLTFAASGEVLREPVDARWTIGFDCAHYMDLMPQMAKRFKEAGIFDHYTGGQADHERDTPRYRDIAYVRAEVELLAVQALTVPQWVEYRLRDAAARSPRKKRKAQVYAALAKRIGNRRLKWRGAAEKRMRKTMNSFRRSLPPPPPNFVGPSTPAEFMALSNMAAEVLQRGASLEREE